MNIKTDIATLEPKQPAEALQEQREWLSATLSSRGHSVLSTDTGGGVTFLKPGGSVLDRLDAIGRSKEAAGPGFQDRQ